MVSVSGLLVSEDVAFDTHYLPDYPAVIEWGFHLSSSDPHCILLNLLSEIVM